MPRLVSKSLYSVFFSGMPAATPWEPRPLAPLEAQWDFGDELRKGRSLLEGTWTEDGKTPVAVWNFMFRPILEAMTLCLEEANRIEIVPWCSPSCGSRVPEPVCRPLQCF